MSRTYRKAPYNSDGERAYPDRHTPTLPGRGRYLKRAYNKAHRRAFKGTGKARTVARLASELGYYRP